MEVGDLFAGLGAEQRPLVLKPVLIDVTARPDDELRTHGAMTPVDLLFKHIFSLNSIGALRPVLAELAKAPPQMQFYGVQYLIDRVDRNKVSKRQFLESALQYLDKDMISIADEIRAEGRQEGRQEGLRQGEQDLLLRLLKRKFGEVPARCQAKIAKANIEQLSLWAERVLIAQSIKEVFN